MKAPPDKNNWKERLEALKINGSFPVSLNNISSVRVVMNNLKQDGYTFTSAKESSTKFRVWRVK